MTHSKRIVLSAFLSIASIVGSPARLQSQQLSRRLILKDGSYQAVNTYEVKGDRVRYLSAERNEWEELPSSLVDWKATEGYEKQRAAAPAIPEAATIDKETRAERETEEMRLPQVSPGLHLPEYSGMFLLDNFMGQPQLVEVQQNEGDVNHSAKANILRGLSPISSAKQTIELEGEHAKVFSHVSVPSIYINVDEDEQAPEGQTASSRPSQPSLDAPRDQPQQPQQPEKAIVPFNRFRLVKLKVKGGKRIVGEVKRAPTGKVSQDQDSVKTTIDKVGSGWLKLTPIQELQAGEYAIVETTGADTINLYVWPFAVNSNAPANANPWMPDSKPEPNSKPEPDSKPEKEKPKSS